jgi:uncharacterized protein (TIGR02117 family)
LQGRGAKLLARKQWAMQLWKDWNIANKIKIMRIAKKLICILLLILCSACAHNEVAKINHEQKIIPIYVVHYDWHTGLIIRTKDILRKVIPEKQDFANAKYLEIGWGQRDFYRAKDYGSGLAFRALFIDNASTMYVHGIYTTPEEEYRHSKLVRLKLTKHNFDAMMQKISASFARNGAMQAKSIPHPYKLDSLFYDANGEYGVGNTCNHWTAEMLHYGGVEIEESWLLPLTASDVIKQASEYGQLISTYH